MTKNANASFSDKMKLLTPSMIMAVFVLIVQVGALWLSATEYIESQPPLENPESYGYSIYYIIVLLVVSALLVYLIKINKTLVIRTLIYFSIFMTLWFVFATVIDMIVEIQYLEIVAIAFSLIFTILIYKYPEWYIIDIAGLLIATGACSVIGSSLSYMPIIAIMVALLIYDFISVYKTKHMLTLAHGMMDLKLPILFVIPKTWNYSYIKEDFSGEKDITNPGKEEVKAESIEQTESAEKSIEENTKAHEDEDKKGELGALFMGLGDAVIPTLLVISANHFLEYDGWISTPSLFTIIGTFVGFMALMYVVSNGKPQAGLPFLNTGAILGFFIGVFVSGTTIAII